MVYKKLKVIIISQLKSPRQRTANASRRGNKRANVLTFFEIECFRAVFNNKISRTGQLHV